MVTLHDLHQLQTPEGMALLNQLAVDPPTSATMVGVATRLRKLHPPELVSAAMAMADLRQRAAVKFGPTDALWFSREGLEQASSAAIAHHRARRYRDCAAVVDLCCGIGGDLLGLAETLPIAMLLAVDVDPLHLEIARLNMRARGHEARVQFMEADVRDVALPDIGGVFIDPARRSGSGRMALGESEPPLEWATALATSTRSVGIKAAPGLDHSRVPAGWEFETVALGTDLKEAAIWSPELATTTRSATVIGPTGIMRLLPVPGDPIPLRAPEVGDMLLDPNPAVTRAGLVEDLARTLGDRVAKIDPSIAFLVSDRLMETPFARTLSVIASLPWHERKLKAVLKDLDAGPVDVRRRGLAGDVDAIAKRLRGRGKRPLTIAMTRVMDQPWAIVCEPVA